MPVTQNIEQLRGSTVVDLTGDKIGKVEEIYLDDQTNEPEWLLVNTGMFGTRSTFIPLQGADAQDEGIRVPFEKAKVNDAPGVEPDRQLSRDEEAELYRYYGLEYSMDESGSGLPEGSPGLDARGAVGHDTSGPTTDSAMTRSEEQVRVGTSSEEAGRARLRKYVVTENVQQTVPVQHEEVRVEREPITDANIGDAMDGPEISEEEHEVTLRKEVPVVDKQAVPVERVRLEKDTVTDEAQVETEVRKEQVDTDGDSRR
ncbi:MAG: DUF2382 domain-containing protein [Nitriliruptorales bacterium]|nr:DUF2382 domain-containing protein [Nitriliruptorales bacterium]